MLVLPVRFPKLRLVRQRSLNLAQFPPKHLAFTQLHRHAPSRFVVFRAGAVKQRPNVVELGRGSAVSCAAFSGWISWQCFRTTTRVKARSQNSSALVVSRTGL